MLRLFARQAVRASSKPSVRSFGAAAPEAELKKTALYDTHVKLGGRMVPYAGYSLPVQYPDGVVNSHNHCRNGASLFDVSHMGQLVLTGSKRIEFLESLVPSDLAGLKEDQARLAVLLNEKGGIIDDCMITRRPDHVYMVVNAGCKAKDVAHLRAKLQQFNTNLSATEKVVLNELEDRALVALQGPQAAQVLQSLLPNVDLNQQQFMFSRNYNIFGVDCWVNRCGYTGEDGFEISVPNDAAPEFFLNLSKIQGVLPAGLAVRDSLRLESGLCLYGHDISEDISPIEAGLAWLVAKRRREEGGFPGYEAIMNHIKNGVEKKRVGLSYEKGAPAREGALIKSQEGEVIGNVTSGTLSPVLKKPIAMGYVKSDFAKVGTKVGIDVRGKINEAEIVKMPFVPARYFKPT